MQRAKRKQPLKFINKMAKITDYNDYDLIGEII